MNNKSLNIFFIATFALISMYVVYITDISFGDRSNYLARFFEAHSTSLSNYLKNTDYEILYTITVYLISMVTEDPIIFFVILHILFLIILIPGLNKIGGLYFISYTMFIYLTTFIYFPYVLNGIRQGLAMVSIILIIGFLLQSKRKEAIIASIVSVLFHYSSLPFILLVFVIEFLNRKLKFKYLLIGYAILAMLYILNVQHAIVGFLNFEYYLTYTSADSLERFGETNNPLFLLFNTFFLLLFYCIYYFFFKDDEKYIFIYKCYIAFSMFFILFGHIAYSNRLATYSWYLVPLLLSYYLMKSKNIFLKILALVILLVSSIISGVYDYYLI